MASDGYFVPAGRDGEFELFDPTEHTLSVWSPDMQHGGPPSGLLTWAMEQLDPAVDATTPSHQITRVVVDILGAIPLTQNRVRAYVTRPGRQISLVGAELQAQGPDGDFRTVARASAWRIRHADTAALVADSRAGLAPREASPDTTGRLGVDWDRVGFIGTLDISVVESPTGGTPAAWLRPRLDLIAGRETTTLSQMMVAADVANGLGTRLNPREWTWMNTDLDVHLRRAPHGEWLGIDAELFTGTTGFGATFGDFYDESGFLGRSAQTVLLGPVPR
ncbi:thioesterase family protein [Gordonia jinhuaensis]|uniref:Thioesterase n=1 Tax=Gordonia jinhuaensis TaxID=1517702 RepID=A0A916SYV6_9ACTN|nr:thioesterase family protein [Gordonia jinhuaensis]GGB24295.1 thioesterase [Gordonia jinhuaensis]